MCAETKDEAEFTEEMLKAGTDILDADTAQDIIDGWANPREVVAAVYRAMHRFAPSMPPSRPSP